MKYFMSCKASLKRCYILHEFCLILGLMFLGTAVVCYGVGSSVEYTATHSYVRIGK